jgi:tetratricopeptide (TPR) repeat protein
VAGHILAAHEDGTHRFRHALLREVVEDDLLPGERAALHLALARALEPRIDAGAGAQLTAALAHHFAAAGDQPRALAWAVRAAGTAERVHAHGEAAALLDRALELWDRVPDPEACAGTDRVTLLLRSGEAAGAVGDSARQLAVAEAALAALDLEREPARAARVLESMAKAQRALNRPRDSVATLERALTLLGADDPASPGRARLLAMLARARMLDGRFGDGVGVARRAIEAAAAAGMRSAEGHARNTLGCCLAMSGDVETGVAELREAVRIARACDHVSDLSEAYVNLADVLHVMGRTPEARAVAAEGREAVGGRRPHGTVWLDAQLSEMAFDAGDWAAAEAHLPAPQRWTGPHTRMNLGLRRAQLDLGRGDHAAVEANVAELTRFRADSSEPQYLAPLGVLTAELRRRQGDVEAARAAVEEALDRIEFCTEDALRVSTVAAAGVAVEADAAERARDLRDQEAERTALRRGEDLLARVAAAVAPNRPVARAQLLEARAEAGRGAGRR